MLKNAIYGTIFAKCNFIFDLYGTLVDIHTNEQKPSLWKKLALFYSFQNAPYTGRELRNRYRQLETAARTVPSPYACPEICAADIFRTLYIEKGIQPTEELTATGQFFRIESLNTLQCYPATIDTLQQDEGCCKPDPAFFRILLDRYRLDPDTCLMIGNERQSDLAGAIAAGIDCCYIHTATSSGSAEEPPKEARFAVMDGDSRHLRELLFTLLPDRSVPSPCRSGSSSS